MEIRPGTVSGVVLISPDVPEFHTQLDTLLGRASDQLLDPALPYSVLARNCHSRAVALLGIRFDMNSENGRSWSVVHYADTLRHPEQSAIRPGSLRFVCAEPLYTDFVLNRATEIHPRGPMNLENLRTANRVRAGVDCVAFDDGRFEGPDTLHAFDRFEAERTAEIGFVEELLRSQSRVEIIIEQALEIPPDQTGDRALLARRALARRLHDALATGGWNEVAARARNHRPRIRLWRQ